MKVVTIYHNKPAAFHEMSSNMNLYAAAPRRDIALCAFLLCSMLLASFARAQEYTITNLGSITPSGINMWGQVAGTQNGHAVVWGRWSGTQDLGTLSGGTFSSGAAINDLGVVTGIADGSGTIHLLSGSDLNCNGLVQPFIWTAHKGMDGLGASGIGQPNYYQFLCSNLYTYPTGINIRNQMVASIRDFDTYLGGYLWSKTTGTVGVPGYSYQSRVNGINNVGTMVGEISGSGPFPSHGGGPLTYTDHAAIWKTGGALIPIDLGTLGGADWVRCSAAISINDRGYVVGWSGLQDSTCLGLKPGFDAPHAFLWTEATGMHDLRALFGDSASMAKKINYFGQVIGISGSVSSLFRDSEGRLQLTGRPFIWTERGGMRDLNNLIPSNSGWVLNTVSDINVWGQIIGVGTRDGENRGFLLTPKVL